MINNHPHSQAMVIDVETASPPHCLTQQEVLGLLTKNIRLSGRALQLYLRFCSDTGIHQRHFAWDDMRQLLSESMDEKMQRFEYWSVRLSVEACQRILKRWALEAKDIDAVFAVTCTGYLCPGLSSYVSQQLGLSENVYTLDFVGLGCSGAIPALRAADDYLNRYEDATVLVIAAEICSAAARWLEKPELILSNAIFSDGAAVAILTSKSGVSGLRIANVSSILWPHLRDELRFKYVDSCLCNVISINVPDLAADAVQTLCKSLEADTNYAFHTSGRKVLDSIQRRLNFFDEQMLSSRKILRDYGNMSSPSVLFVLKDILNKKLKNKSPVVCFTFGAGFSSSILEAQWKC